MSKIRLIVKVPENCQTGPESWQDTTGFQSFVVDVPDELYILMDRDQWSAVVVGAEKIETESHTFCGRNDE